MKRIALVALPLVVVGLALLIVLVLARRRRDATPAPVDDASAERSDHADPARPQVAPGVEVLRGYDERHEEEEEAKHGAVLHLSTERISVRQV